MNKDKFPYLAAGIGFIIVIILLQAGAGGSELKTGFPLLTLLFLCEFGFFMTVAGAIHSGFLYSSKRKQGLLIILIVCVILFIYFLFTGIDIWQSYVSP